MNPTQRQSLNRTTGSGLCGSDIPAYIEETAHQLGAVYAPDHVAVLKNIDADGRRIRSYLGTYFPRTVFEFQTIVGELLSVPQMNDSMRKSKPLRVLDLGSGTGGAWIGLASALAKAGIAKQLTVDAIDGNAIALGVQQSFATAISEATGISVELKTHHVKLGLARQDFACDLSAVLASLPGKFDIVLVSKHLSEFYHESFRAATGIIQDALQLLSGVLRQNGYLIVLDMTDQLEGGREYFPKTMARETARYLMTASAHLKPILPMPCALHMGSACASRGGCYTQRKLEFFHNAPGAGYCRRADTKVSYRVFTTARHAEQICAMHPRDQAYCVNAHRPLEVCQGGKVIEIAGIRPNGFIPCSI